MSPSSQKQTHSSKTGTCLLCRRPLTFESAAKHLFLCTGKDPGIGSSLLLRVTVRNDPSFWMFLVVRPDATFFDIKTLLEDVWINSIYPGSFLCDGREYPSPLEGSDHDIPVSAVFRLGLFCTYTLRSERPIVLDLFITDRFPDIPDTGRVCIVARNLRPPHNCGLCGGSANYFCESCFFSCHGPFLCESCLNDHDCHYDAITVIANSPLSELTGYREKPDLAVRWYPPGWTAADIVPLELYAVLVTYRMQYPPDDDDWDWKEFPSRDEHDCRMQFIYAWLGRDIDSVLAMAFPDLDPFIVLYYREAILQFLWYMVLYGMTDISDWDGATVITILSSHLIVSPRPWPYCLELVIMILARFFDRIAGKESLPQIKECISALYEYDQVFYKNCLESWSLQFYPPLLSHDVAEEMAPVSRESMVYPLSRDHARVVHKTGRVHLPVLEEIEPQKPTQVYDPLPIIRYIEIRKGIERYCEEKNSSDILPECIRNLHEQAEYSESPLKKGNCAIWAGSIIYEVSQDLRKVKRGESTAFAASVASFFGVSPDAVRSGSSRIRRAQNEIFRQKNPDYLERIFHIRRDVI
ncbi:MAG: hypothetical protein JXA44_05090 [Methanospirillaceae archaeon]|nr:hypothetical protein [Methanospirillaceae archaeon]